MATDPSPDQGVLRWAFSQARRRLNTFLVGGVVLAIVFIFASAVITLPAGPTWSQRFWNGLIAFGLAMAAVVVVTLLYALLFAPYQQRNKLRRELSAKERKRLPTQF